MSIDDATLLAYVDDELDAERRAAVDAALAEDHALAKRIARHRMLRGRVAGAYAPVLEEPVPERLLALLDDSHDRVVGLEAARSRRRGGSLLGWGAMAACLVVGVVTGALVPMARPPLISSGPAGLQARGALARALDQQLASQAQPDAIRIGLSFMSARHRYCRTFQAADRGLAGLACREPDGWRVQMAVAQAAPAAQAGYRMAGSELPPAVLQAAQSLMVGEPLDRAGEAAAKARGWRQ